MNLSMDTTGWVTVLGPYAAASVALLAAVGSFVASWLTIGNARRAQRLQLEHDARVRDRERTMALKRDVYIPIVQAISRAQAALGQLIGPDVDHKTLAVQLAEDLSTIAKIHVVGSEQTISAMMRYVKVLAPAHLQFSLAHADLVSRKQAIERESALMGDAEAAMNRFKERAGELHIAGNGDAQAGRLKDLMDSEAKSDVVKRHWTLNLSNARVFRLARAGRIGRPALHLDSLSWPIRTAPSPTVDVEQAPMTGDQ
jgi:hypothetical protein